MIVEVALDKANRGAVYDICDNIAITWLVASCVPRELVFRGDDQNPAQIPVEIRSDLNTCLNR